jgi:uncharacterized protein (TIGR01244 family)
MTLHTRHALCLLVLTLLGCGAAFADEEDKKKGPPKLEACELGSTYNVHRVGKIYLAGQPSPEDFQLAKKEGVKTVINLRPDSELKWNEKDVLKDVGLEYHHFPFREPESLKDKVFDDVRKLLRDKKKQPVILHCASANRVGAVWLVHRVLDDGVKLEDALKEARTVGLKFPPYESLATQYIAREVAKKKPDAKK